MASSLFIESAGQVVVCVCICIRHGQSIPQTLNLRVDSIESFVSVWWGGGGFAVGRA